MTIDFDPNAAATSEGLFGLPFLEKNSQLVIQPVPFDATTSYRSGTATAPERVLEASHQVDLFVPEFAGYYSKGIFLSEISEKMKAENEALRSLCTESRESAAPLTKVLAEINERMKHLNEQVYAKSRQSLAAGKLAGLLGGDHSTPFGHIRAVLEKFPQAGILHFDAHFDLRKAYEGFQYSHASIFYNVMTELNPAKLVQVGLRDFCEEEWNFAKNHERIRYFTSAHLFEEKAQGRTLADLTNHILSELPREVYVSVDIDALDPSYCPETGTPVPGGLAFEELQFMIRKLVESKRVIVGFDLNEVGPGEYDAIVGARILYYLSLACLKSHS